MICAYDRVYLDRAMLSFGEMLDFAVYDLKMELQAFYRIFLESDAAERFACGDSGTIAGRSGIELVYDVLKIERRIEGRCPCGRTPEYWTGWALAYFQWASARRFPLIERYLPIEEILGMYHPYHEMDVKAFYAHGVEVYNRRKKETNLKLLRQYQGLSQGELSDLSGIPVRTIQQYEQRQKRINRASFRYVVSLSGALRCRPEELLEIEVDEYEE